MAIHPPGERFRYNAHMRKNKTKRDVTAILSLTAMVDMFTVLVVFLLQNYNVTGQVLYIPKEVVLPKASSIKELAPSIVVTISNKEVLVDKDVIITYDQLKAQQEWMIPKLMTRLKQDLEKVKTEYEQSIKKKLQSAVEKARGTSEPELNPWNKVTIQADKGMDFLTVKKVMYTVTEAGAQEINFAVNRDKKPAP
jgi:biopolymer transport protein ExbD